MGRDPKSSDARGGRAAGPRPRSGVSSATPARRRASARRRIAAAGLAAILFPAGTAAAQDAGAPAPRVSDDVELDQLLKLPDSYLEEEEGARRGGLTEEEWRKRFRDLRGALRESEEALRESEQALEKGAREQGNYQVAAPGLTNPESGPAQFGLTQKIRRQREAVESRRKALRRLEIEADVAEVPQPWRDG